MIAIDAFTATGLAGSGASREGLARPREARGAGQGGAECAANPLRVPITRVGVAGLCPAEPERGRVWEPSQGSHLNRVDLQGWAG